MRIYLPNSAHLQNIEGFIRKYSPEGSSKLEITSHPTYIHVHPFALAMTACAGVTASNSKQLISQSIADVRSMPYLIRMKLFDYLGIAPGKQIVEREQSGRFIPLTQITTSKDLKSVISDLIPLLHTETSIADPIRYVVSELGRNVLEHAQSGIGAFVCAQYFRDQQRIAIGMADSGCGILTSIIRSHKAENEAKSIALALTPGVSGATSRIGGNETNAGAGLFFIRSIAKMSGNYFAIYSGNTLYKLKRHQKEPSMLYGNPLSESYSLTTDLPYWQGTVIGIDISVTETKKFAALLNIISNSYHIDVRSQKKTLYKNRIQFT